MLLFIKEVHKTLPMHRLPLSASTSTVTFISKVIIILDHSFEQLKVKRLFTKCKI